ncbi:Major facilitator superfamily domain, general substrate transporter [Penicillium griseofulvum]|uniref:Major facilitator superfamily domain, general substrate transporter n=1 Tax=Penicillium patulum TaxID=5078 RepID=A0A135LX27_PENPA|nr:Major facilitator superfamily domain, general substrate transporter [Penicillium griseofulvum]KXG53520.1 Major facilitator superfamily domain, general substrate transporter [Penicillium griseofulvum]
MTAESTQRVGNHSSTQIEGPIELLPITSTHSNSPTVQEFEEDEKGHDTNVQSTTEEPIGKGNHLKRFVDLILWTPPRCRWDVENPSKFGLPLNLLFAFSGTFTVANLYYSHPILDVLAQFFNVSHERVSLIPTCSQAGYATGLILLCPLGDLVRRRHFVLLLTLITAVLWIGICVTDSFETFLVLSYLSSVTTVTPQIMLPLVGDLAPPARRATALSIVSSGLMLGLLFARLLSGIVAEYSHWRNIYWLSLALQFLIFTLLWLFMPDYPSTNTNISYFKILYSIIGYFWTSPELVQATLMGLFLSATFTSFWTTLTFLLSGAPYNYPTLTIGLFSLAGLTPMFLGPPYSRYMIDKFVPQFSVLVSLGILIVGVSIGTYTGTFTVAGPIIQAALQDFGLQMTQIANRVSIYAVAPKARNRINTGYMMGVFCGQLMGTSVGNRLYSEGGWILSGSVNLGFIGAALIICLLRGPAEKGWIGWHGGIRIRRTE